MADPLSCPFCGSSTLRLMGTREYPTEYRMVCLGCSGTGPFMSSQESAVLAWNGGIMEQRNKERKEYFERYGLEYPGDLEDDRDRGNTR